MEPRDTETYRVDNDRVEDTRPEEPPLAPGDVLGHFEILERVGSGGMGAVYSARDRTLDRKVAIKVLRHDRFASEGRRARLLREAQALGKIIHPNVVTVYEAGEDKDRLYIAMEFVEGETLQAWLAQPRSWRDIVAKIVPAGRGLVAAHDTGLVHRDFKPENVFLGKDGRVRVGDFGVVGIAGATAAGDSPSYPSALSQELTETGTLVGTPRYMSPEQYEGQTIDARADQFAFAATLYGALFRQTPFAGRKLGELRDNVRAGNIRPVPRGSGVPGWLSRIVLRGLAVAPAERFPTLEAMLAALERGPAVTPRRAAAVAAVLVVGLGGWQLLASRRDTCRGAADKLAGTWDGAVKAAVEKAFLASGRPYAADTYRRASAALDGYASSWVTTRTDACRATAVRREQSAELLDARMACLDRRLDGMQALTRLFARAADGDVVDRAVAASLGLEPIDGCAAAVVQRGARAARSDPALQHRVDEAAAQVSAGKGRAVQGELKALVDAARAARDKHLLAEVLVLSGRAAAEKDPRGAVASYEEAVSLAGDVDDDDLAARALLQLMGAIGSNQQRWSDALALRPAVEAAVKRTKNDRHLAVLLRTVGRVQYVAGQYADALATLDQAIALIDRTAGPESLEKARALRDRGDVLTSLERMDEAQAAGTQALATAEKMLGPDHLDITLYVGSLGSLEWRRRRLDAAETYFQRMLDISERALGPESIKGATALARLGSVANDQRRFAAALAYFVRAIAMQQRLAGADDVGLASMYNNMGITFVGLNRLDDAVAAMRRALEIREKTLPPTHPDLSASVLNIGSLLDQSGRAAEAIPWLERAVSIDEKSLPPSHPATMHARVTLARAYLDAGRPAPAVPLLERAERDLGADPDVVAQAHIRFQQARALRAQGGDVAKAKRMARAARVIFAADPPDPEMLREVDRFLAK